MSDIHAQRIEEQLSNDFGWLDELKVTVIDGRPALGSKLDNGDLPFNVSKVMLETEFVRDWLLRFALGNTIGVNYFNLPEWGKFTENGVRSVLVGNVNEEGTFEPSLIVPPLITNLLSPEDFQKLRDASVRIHANNEDTMKKKDLTANYGIAKMLVDEKLGIQAKQVRYSDLITPSFFAKYKIVPEVEQQLYYIRDVVRKGRKVTTDIEDLNKARDILFRDHMREKVSNDEYFFVYELSLQTYILDGKLITLREEEAAAAAAAANEENEGDIDPLSC